jgi:hypothetical protein
MKKKWMLTSLCQHVFLLNLPNRTKIFRGLFLRKLEYWDDL